MSVKILDIVIATMYVTDATKGREEVILRFVARACMMRSVPKQTRRGIEVSEV